MKVTGILIDLITIHSTFHLKGLLKKGLFLYTIFGGVLGLQINWLDPLFETQNVASSNSGRLHHFF